MPQVRGRGRTSSLEGYDITMEMGALPAQMLEEARGKKRLFREAAVAGIMEAQAYTQSVLWEHTPHGSGLARTLVGFDPPSAFDKEPMGYIGWMAPASRYLLFVELGTKPFSPPLGPLQVWAARKFGDIRVAFRARGSIAAHGIKPQRFVLAAAEEAQPIAGRIMLARVLAYINEFEG